MRRCPNCDSAILSDTRWDNWIKVMNFIECLQLEESISAATAASMSDAMMSFKRYAMEDMPDDDEKKNTPL